MDDYESWYIKKTPYIEPIGSGIHSYTNRGNGRGYGELNILGPLGSNRRIKLEREIGKTPIQFKK